MKVSLTPAEERTAKAWLPDILLAAGIKKEGAQKTDLVFTPELIDHAKRLCQELIHRACNNVDASIAFLAAQPFHLVGEAAQICLTPEEIAKYIVFLAQKTDVFWDFTDVGLVRRMDFGETVLGHQVYVHRQYIWARDQKSSVVHPSQRKIYMITGSGNSLAQINPSSPHSSHNGSNIVALRRKAASNPACVCYFFTQADAEAFLENMLRNGVAELRRCNPQVEEQGYVNERGYLLFGTEFGDCMAEVRELRDIWTYRVDCYKDGNPLNRLSDERWELFVDALFRE